MTLWWLQQGWTETKCAACGDKIWPAGDPDWGLCEPCFTAELEAKQQEERDYGDIQDRGHE